jgi:cytochrome c peroxidase
MKSMVFFAYCLLVFLSVTENMLWAQVPAESGTKEAVVQHTPAPPSTKTLPILDVISDHQLLDSTDKMVRLSDLIAGKIAVVSFIYLSCPDVGGCPLATSVLQQVDQMLNKRPELAKQVTLISLSFDRERDTPKRLAELRRRLAPQTTWHFVASGSQGSLFAILADFGHQIAEIKNDKREWSGLFRHVLKVYLLDTKHQVRNVYSAGTLQAQFIIEDIESVLAEIP